MSGDEESAIRRPRGGERHDLVAGEEAVGLRLDVWLVQRLPSLSRARLQALIDEGCVLLDGNAHAGLGPVALRTGRPRHRARPGPG